MKSVLVAGGAGFVGSRITDYFLASGWSVTVVDGLMPRTGGREANLDDRVNFIKSRIEDAGRDLEAALAATDVVIDAMGWT